MAEALEANDDETQCANEKMCQCANEKNNLKMGQFENEKKPLAEALEANDEKNNVPM